MSRFFDFIFVMLFALVGAAHGQQLPRAMYPLILNANAKPLSVGTLVWANFGDSECAYPRDRMHSVATDACMSVEYHKAKIAKVSLFHGYGEYHWIYTIEFLDGHFKGITRNAGFEEAYIIVNPEKWGEYSKYFVLLNW